MCLAAHSKKLLSNTFPENGPFIENVKNAVSYFKNAISLMLKNDPKPSMFIVSIFANGNLKELFSLLLPSNSLTFSSFFSLIFCIKCVADVSPHFSPLIICVLEKCQRVLKSGSGTFTLAEKSIISLYVSNTLTYLLQTQVNFKHLAFCDRFLVYNIIK